MRNAASMPLPVRYCIPGLGIAGRSRIFLAKPTWITDSVITLRWGGSREGIGHGSRARDFCCSYQGLVDFLDCLFIYNIPLGLFPEILNFLGDGGGVCLLEFCPVIVVFWIALLQGPSHCHSGSRSLKNVLILENYCVLYNTERDLKEKNYTIKSIVQKKHLIKFSTGFRTGKSISFF